MTKYKALTDLAIGRMGRHVQLEDETKVFIKKMVAGFRDFLQCPESCFRVCNVDEHLNIVRQAEKLMPRWAAEGFSYFAIELRLAHFKNNFVDAWLLLGVRKGQGSTFTVRFSFIDAANTEDTAVESLDTLYAWLFDKIARDLQRPAGPTNGRFGFYPA
jgi:hypothetical protein